jgi:hypothetical protein
MIIEWSSKQSPEAVIYANDSVKFAWLSKPTEDGKYKIATNWHSCRETFIYELYRISKNDKDASKLIDLRRTRVAVVRKHGILKIDGKVALPKNDGTDDGKTIDEYYDGDIKWMKASLRILNIIEKTQGWGLSQLKLATDIDYCRATGAALFVFNSSVKWMRSPQLLSLYLLIIRLGRFHGEFSNFEGFNDLKKIYKKISTIKITEHSGNVDRQFFMRSFKMWELMLDNHRNLFFKKSLLKNHLDNRSSWGIDELEKLNATKEIKELWSELKKQEALT